MKLIITGPAFSEEFYVKKNRVIIGRDESCDWRIKSDKLSKIHCEFKFNHESKRMTVTDLNSKNGVMVDGIKIDPNKPTQINLSSTVFLANQYILHVAEADKQEPIEKLYSKNFKKKNPLPSKPKKSSKKEVLKKILLIFSISLIFFGILTFYFGQ